MTYVFVSTSADGEVVGSALANVVDLPPNAFTHGRRLDLHQTVVTEMHRDLGWALVTSSGVAIATVARSQSLLLRVCAGIRAGTATA